MQLGIYAPYNYSETTTAAIQLASLALQLDVKVSYLAPEAIVPNVHSYWDRHVRAGPDKRLTSWAHDSDFCVWFSANNKRLKQALSIRSRCKHILAVPWHQLDDTHQDWLHWYDVIVCPSQPILASLHRNSGKLEMVAKVCPWASSLRASPRDAPWDNQYVSFVMPLCSATQKYNEKEILEFAEMLLTNNANAKLSIVPAKSWSKTARFKLGRLRSEFNSRFRCSQPLTPDHSIEFTRMHDCVLATDTTISYGAQISRYKALGMPVIAWDIDPNRTIINDNIDGKLVPCMYDSNAWGAEKAHWHTIGLVSVCTGYCQDPSTLTGLMGSNDTAATSQRFHELWEDLLQTDWY